MIVGSPPTRELPPDTGVHFGRQDADEIAEVPDGRLCENHRRERRRVH